MLKLNAQYIGSVKDSLGNTYFKYVLTGSEEAIAQYKEDKPKSRTHNGNPTLIDKLYAGGTTIVEKNDKGYWNLNTDELDEMKSIASGMPDGGFAFMMSWNKAKKKAIDEVIESAPEITDGDAPF